MATVEKRPLTAEEQAEAGRLMAAWLAFKESHPGVTQAWLGSAAELGSQGLIGQYLRGIIPLNLRALVSICGQIGADASQISPRLMKPFHDFNRAGSDEEKSSALEALTAAGKEYKGDTNPGGNRLGKGLNKSFNQKLAAFRDELARAESEGQLSEEKIDLLLGVLRLDDRASSPRRHTRKKILAESVPGQSGERIKREGSR
ncbi:hypothetical protein [Paraburkholderia xenovorans]|jgi:hypothetical protein